jgi:cobyrinic acid a,c-diamide synthase
VRLEETADFPWPGNGTAVRLGHEFHHSSLENLDPSVRTAYRVQRGQGIGGARDGVRVHNVLASYAHLRHTGGNDWPRRFIAFVRDVRRDGETPAPRPSASASQEAAWSMR